MSRARVAIAGQMPPPVGGQNLNIKRLYELLLREPSVEAVHWKFGFSHTLSEFRRFRIGKLLELFRVIARLVRLRLQGRIDALIYPSGGPHTFPILRDVLLLPIACAMSRRVWVHFRAAGIAERLPRMNRLFRWAARAAHAGCYGAIVQSDYGRRDPQALGIERIALLYNGVEDSNPRATVRDETSTGATFLCVGHICENKGTPALVRAFATIATEYPNARLRLVGECLAPFTPPMLQELVRSSGVADRIEMVGLREGDRLMNEYRTADVFVFPTIAPYESFGMVLIEAMMWSLPIVVSDWRACREIAGDRGGISYAIGDDHERSLAAALRAMLERRAEWPEFSRQNRARYEERYTIEALRQNLLHILTGVSGESREPRQSLAAPQHR